MLALEAHVGRVRFAVSPAIAGVKHVELDGVPIGELVVGGTRPVDPGDHVLRVEMAGDVRGVARFRISEGEVQTVTVKLQIPPAPALTPQPTSSVSPAATDLSPPPPAYDRTVPVALMITGGALFATGAVVGLLGWSQAKSAPSQDSPDVGAARTKAIIGDVLGGTGIATFAVGGYFFLRPRSAPAAPQTAGVVTPWFAGSAAGLRVAF